MAARFPGLIALAVAALLARDGWTQEPGSDAGIRVISGETLRLAGATRLSDVLSLAGGWDVSTVDGFTWHASALGGDPFLPARWTVLVDGRRVDPDLFGIASLDRLGVSVDQVSRIELSERPRLEGGELATGGLIHIRTVEPREGASVHGWFTTGSEIGDPGPFAFTPNAAPNVDRTGHQASAGVAYRDDAWFAEASLAREELVPTDPAIEDRYRAALGGRPRLHNTAPGFRLGARLGGGRHEAVFRQSRADGALGLSPFAGEIGTEERYTLAGVAGSMPAGGRELSYDVSHAIREARRRPAAPGPPLDWEVRSTEARLELVRPGSPLERTGVRLRRAAVRIPASLEEPTILLGSVYAGLRLGSGSEVPTASASLTVGEQDVGVRALLSRRWSLARRTVLEGLLTVERGSTEEDATIWAWTERGYDLLGDAGADVAILGSRASPVRLGADLWWSTRPSPNLELAAGTFYRRARRLAVERRELHFVPETASFEGPTTLVHGTGGEQSGGSLALRMRPLPGLAVALSYWLRGTIAGDRIYRDAWRAVPRHGALATAEFVPVEGLGLWMGGRYRGASRWAEFGFVSAESGGRYQERVGAAFTLDLALQKLLWDGRLRAHAGVRNLLGATLRYHPAGASFAPTAVLQIEGSLP